MGNPNHRSQSIFKFLQVSGRNKKKTTKMKLLLVLVLGIVSIGGITGSVIPETKDVKREIELSDDVIAMIIIEQLELEGYGIMDIITQLPGIIANLKPLITGYIDIIKDSSLTLSEKVAKIWQHTKNHMGDLIKLVGSTGAREIIKKIIEAAAGSLGR